MRYTLTELKDFQYSYPEQDIKKTIKVSDALQSIDVVGPNENAITEQLVEFNSGEHIRKIVDGSFAGCSALTAVTLQKKTTYIGSEAFRDCINLKLLNLDNTQLEHVGNYAFSNTGIRRLEMYCMDNNANTLSGTFSGCSQLNTAVISTNVIADNMFSDCTALKYASISLSGDEDQRYVGTNVFAGCTNVDTVLLDGNIMLSDWFIGCVQLKTLGTTSESDVVYSSANSFSDCNRLTTLCCNISCIANSNKKCFAKSSIKKIVLQSELSSLCELIVDDASFDFNGIGHNIEVSTADNYHCIWNDAKKQLTYDKKL